MDNFHKNYKDKDNFLKSGYNFRDWGYLDPPKVPPFKDNKLLHTKTYAGF